MNGWSKEIGFLKVIRLVIFILTDLIVFSIAFQWRRNTPRQHGRSYQWSPLRECRVKEHIQRRRNHELDCGPNDLKFTSQSFIFFLSLRMIKQIKLYTSLIVPYDSLIIFDQSPGNSSLKVTLRVATYAFLSKSLDLRKLRSDNFMRN